MLQQNTGQQPFCKIPRGAKVRAKPTHSSLLSLTWFYHLPYSFSWLPRGISGKEYSFSASFSWFALKSSLVNLSLICAFYFSLIFSSSPKIDCSSQEGKSWVKKTGLDWSCTWPQANLTLSFSYQIQVVISVFLTSQGSNMIRQIGCPMQFQVVSWLHFPMLIFGEGNYFQGRSSQIEESGFYWSSPWWKSEMSPVWNCYKYGTSGTVAFLWVFKVSWVGE